MKSHFGRGSVLRLGTLLCASWLRTCEGFAPALDGLLLRRTCSSSSIRHHPTSPQRMSEEAGGSTKSGILRRTCGSSSIDHERRRTTTSLRMSEGEGDKAFPLSKSSSVDKMLGTNKPEEMFALTDSDGSGGLDFDEFSSVFGGLGLGMGYAEMRELFEKIDLNKDGVISLSEFRTRMEKDLAEARKMATEAEAVAATAEQEAAVAIVAGAVARNDADTAQQRADDLFRALGQLGL